MYPILGGRNRFITSADEHLSVFRYLFYASYGSATRDDVHDDDEPTETHALSSGDRTDVRDESNVESEHDGCEQRKRHGQPY